MLCIVVRVCVCVFLIFFLSKKTSFLLLLLLFYLGQGILPQKVSCKQDTRHFVPHCTQVRELSHINANHVDKRPSNVCFSDTFKRIVFHHHFTERRCDHTTFKIELLVVATINITFLRGNYIKKKKKADKHEYEYYILTGSFGCVQQPLPTFLIVQALYNKRSHES